MRLPYQHGFGRFICEFYADYSVYAESPYIVVSAASRNVKEIDYVSTGITIIHFKKNILLPPWYVQAPARQFMCWFDCEMNGLNLHTWSIGPVSPDPFPAITVTTYNITIDGTTGVVSAVLGGCNVFVWGGLSLSSDTKIKYIPE
jgi:hypothetical protein